jgi:hypothetical protein
MRTAGLLFNLLLVLPASSGEGVQLTPDLDHSPWARIVDEYADGRNRVDYARLKDNDLRLLDRYLLDVGGKWPAEMSSAARKAALINAYNALTVRWVLEHYPVRSIWRTDKPFTARRHRIDGQIASLDEIETRLRQMGDPHVHSVLVCAARSCPPLRREAYVADRLEQQMKDNTRRWLSMRDLNEFVPEKRRASVSSIFDWYRADFEHDGMTLAGFLARFGPAGAGFLARDNAKIDFKDYDWGLNDASSAGDSYPRLLFYWDYFWSKR